MDSNKNTPYLIKIENHSSQNGIVNVISFAKTMPFNVKRLFYVSNSKDRETRGNHSHKECWQFLIPISGTINVYCHDGVKEYNFELNNNSEGLLVPPYVWCSQFYEDTDDILLVLTSEEYDPDDYIHDFNEFIESFNK